MTREFVKSDSNQSSEADRSQFQLNGGMLLLRLASAAEDMPVEPRPVGGQERAPGEYCTQHRLPIKVGRRRRSICRLSGPWLRTLLLVDTQVGRPIDTDTDTPGRSGLPALAAAIGPLPRLC